ncbi:MAG: ABC transporter ATP-binding protein [Promethearchaeota archaeon]|nr:MAG: ABC transporter ATP-binding protein [Candidatus Lokiarchaeota archaeon]
MSKPLILEAREVKRTYMQGKIPVHALRGVNLEIEKGEFIAIVGPSGSGKSTLLHLIGALDVPTEGELIIGGKNLKEQNRNRLAEMRQQVGFVFQYFNLIPRLTALQNVELAIAILGNMKKNQRRQKAQKILEEVGLGDRLFHRPNELSGGQQQRVAIARALAGDPLFLLMDEPTGNIDTKSRDVLLDLIKNLNRNRHITVIIVTHDSYIAQQADRIVYLVDGVLYDKDPTHSSGRVFESNTNQPKEVNQ